MQSANVTKFGVYSTTYTNIYPAINKINNQTSHAYAFCVADSRVLDTVNENGNAFDSFNTMLYAYTNDSNIRNFDSTPYMNMPAKLHHSLRCAYYCSPVIGSNNGTLNNVYVSASVLAADSVFVGFIGGVCGLQNRGTTKDCATKVSFSGRYDERITEANISARTKVYSIEDLSAANLSFTDNDATYGTFEWYYRSNDKSTKFPCSIAIHDGDDILSVMSANISYPAHNGNKNCLDKITDMDMLPLEPCYYDDEPIIYTANGNIFKLYRTTLEGASLRAAYDEQWGNFTINVKVPSAYYPFDNVTAVTFTNSAVTNTKASYVYAWADLDKDDERKLYVEAQRKNTQYTDTNVCRY